MSQPAPVREATTKILRDAQTYCAENGLRLTDGRRRVLELVVASLSVVKAYDLLDELTEAGAKAMPPVVYRALDFWIKHGFIHKIESINGYFACGHPLHNHGCQLLICSQCGCACEVCDADLRDHFIEIADKHGFGYTRSVLEIHGVCSACRER